MWTTDVRRGALAAPRALRIAAFSAFLAAGAAAAQDAPAPADPAPPPGAQTPPADPAPPRTGFGGTLDELAARFPGVVRVREYGRSAGGRPLRIVTVSADREEDIEWSALVVAGLSGLDPWEGPKLALDVAARLAERSAELPPRVAFRVIPEASPDARIVPLRAGNDTPTDEDQDGARDEDGPDDLDGDGTAGWMRIPDTSGGFAADDAAKPGAAPVRADASHGRAPAWTIVREGRDDDGDGAFNEDGPGGVDVSRNFAAFFEEHVPLAGRWAVSEPETRALMDLVLADERITVAYEFGRCETVAANPDWGGTWPKLPDADAKTLDGLRAAHGEGAVPKAKRKPRAPGAGSLGAVVWHQLGRLWLGRAPLGKTAPPWPEAGADEIRGDWKWTPVSGAGVPAGAQVLHMQPATDTKSPPEWWMETDSVTDFLLLLGRERAKPAFAKVQTSGESGVLRVEARLVNAGRLPTHTQRGADVRGRRPLNVRPKLPDGATLLAGKPLVQIDRIGAGEESEPMRWVVAGPPGAIVRIECTGPDTGTASLEVRIP